MVDARFAPYGALVLRLSLSFFFFAHLYRKFAVTGFDPWWNGLVKQGYADWMLGYTVGAEFLGAVLLLLGIYTRTVSLMTLPVILAVANIPHVLDPRDEYTVTELRVTAWADTPTTRDDPFWSSSPEVERAFLNTEDVLRSDPVIGGVGR